MVLSVAFAMNKIEFNNYKNKKSIISCPVLMGLLYDIIL